jgi:hypothetical protein
VRRSPLAARFVGQPKLTASFFRRLPAAIRELIEERKLDFRVATNRW